MAYDLATGQSPTDWSRNGHGLLGVPLAHLERAARHEAQALGLSVLLIGAKALGLVALLGTAAVLGYNQYKSRQSKSDGWDW